MPARINIIGQTFGRLKVIADAPSRRGTQGQSIRCVICDCSCGAKGIEFRIIDIKYGNTSSCGCLWREGISEYSLKHGHSRGKGNRTPTYVSWACMFTRCTNPNAHSYSRYGGRGITICKRWEQFENFLADMGERPNGRSIGRIDGNGNYCPENCRWETMVQQSQNRITTRIITIRGVTGCMKEVCRHFNICRQTIEKRIKRGFSIESAFEKSFLSTRKLAQ